MSNTRRHADDRPRATTRLTTEEIGSRIEAGLPVSDLLAADPTLTVQDIRDAVERYLAQRSA